MPKLRLIGESVRTLLAHLPAVLFLVSICLLGHHLRSYVWIEWLSVKFVASLAQPGDDALSAQEHGRIVTVLAGRQFFATEFSGRLPLDRGTAAALVDEAAAHCPRAIALDIDAARVSDAEPDRAAASKLVQAMRAALDRGIDVVATTYPAQPAKRFMHRQGLDAVCAQLHYSPAQVAPSAAGFADAAPLCEGRLEPGRFALASPMLVTEGPFQLIYRTADEPVSAGRDYRLSRVIAGLMRPPREGGRIASLCEAGRVDAQALAQLDDSPDAAWPDPNHSQRIRFIGTPRDKRVTSVGIDSIQDLKARASAFRDKVVLIGLQTFAGIDEFQTPAGAVPGVLLHAHIANSVDQPMGHSAVVGALADVAIGMLFVLAFLGVQGVQRWLRRECGPHLAALAMLLVPLGLFGAVLLLAAVASASLFARGFWLDPLPIVVGLALHLYVEAGDNAEHSHGHPAPAHAGPGAHTVQQHSLHGWALETAAAWRSSLGFGPGNATFDTHVLSLVRLLMVGTVLVAVVSLLVH